MTTFKGFSQVKEATETHFHNLYTEEGIGNEDLTTDFLSHMSSLVSGENNASIMKPFSEGEINNILWAMEPDKASTKLLQSLLENYQD